MQLARDAPEGVKFGRRFPSHGGQFSTPIHTPTQPPDNRFAITERVTHRRDYPERLRPSPNRAEAGRLVCERSMATSRARSMIIVVMSGGRNRVVDLSGFGHPFSRGRPWAVVLLRGHTLDPLLAALHDARPRHDRTAADRRLRARSLDPLMRTAGPCSSCAVHARAERRLGRARDKADCGARHHPTASALRRPYGFRNQRSDLLRDVEVSRPT